MNLKPLSDYIVIRPIEDEAVTSFGLVLPQTMENKDKIKKGEVIAVGPGKRLENGVIAPVGVTVGTKVMYKEGWSVEKIKIDGVEHPIVQEQDLMMIIE